MDTRLLPFNCPQSMLHYMTKSMWTPAHQTSHSKIMVINMPPTPYAAITGSTLLGRLSTQCWNIAAGTCFHSATRTLVRSGTDVGWLGLARSLEFQFIPKVFDGIEVRALCRTLNFSHTDLDKPFLYGPLFVHSVIVMLKQEMAFPKLLPQSWKHRLI
jgi:hypothetical protein